MPGGKDEVVRTVVTILTFVAGQQRRVAANTVGQYIGRTFAFDNHRLNEPLWLLERLGLVVIHHQWVHLTSDGRRFIKAKPEAQELTVLTLVLVHFPPVREILQVAVTAEQGFTCAEAHQQIIVSRPKWKDLELTRRPLNWLLSTRAVRERSRTAFEITPRGRKAFADYLMAHPTTQISAPPAQALSAAHIQAVIAELNVAQRDSTHPRRFEEAAAVTMRVLGHSVELVGGSGKTDVVVDAPVNGASYRFIVDAKTCASGAWGDLNPTVLWHHATAAHAQAVVVLAPQCAAGQTVTQAEQHQIVLLPTSVLCDLLHLHNGTPLSILDYRLLLDKPGLLTGLPDALCTLAARQDHLKRCLLAVLECARDQYRYGVNIRLDPTSLFAVLPSHQDAGEPP